MLAGGTALTALTACAQSPSSPTTGGTSPATGAANPSAPSAASSPTAAGAKSASASSGGQSLTIAQSAITSTIDPGIDYSFGIGGGVVYWVYDMLYRNQGEQKVETVPNLADGMPQVSADGLQWTIKMKSGRKFHDGSPVTADDVKFTYDRQFDNKMPGPAPTTLTMVDSVTVVDPLTVRFNLKTPTPWFLVILGDQWANAVVNKKLVMANTTSTDKYPGEKWLATHDAGSGAFMVQDFQPMTKVELARYADWPEWTPGPHLEHVTILNVNDPATQRLMFDRGEVDVPVDMTPDDVNAVLKQSGITQHQFSTDQSIMFFLAGDWTGKPWADKRVRQALVSSFNFEVASNLIGGAQTLDCGFPPELENFTGCTVHYQYDLKKAAALLKDAGYEKGFDLPVGYADSFPSGKVLLEMWQADLKKIGVNMNIDHWTNAVASDMGKKAPSMSGTGSIYPDPMGWLDFWSRPQPPSFRPNEWYSTNNPQAVKFAGIVDQARHEQDNDKRAALYSSAIDILQDEAVWGRFLIPSIRIAYHDSLKGYVGYFRQGSQAVPLTSLYWQR